MISTRNVVQNVVSNCFYYPTALSRLQIMPKSSTTMQCYWMVGYFVLLKKNLFDSFSPMSDQDRISLYNINIISSRPVTRVKKSIS